MKKRAQDVPISWLPIDSRLLAPFISFGHVKGIARLFLEIEIVLAILVVAGTIIYVGVYLFG
ncbi:hypothetical protein HY410_00590 [Candidatus Gottesmanbacteria bacterium]|nr:hypothetical protein [Candidatus Gottesmanbacteria bacterium]